MLVKVSSLYGFDDISDCYSFDTEKLEVVNTVTNTVKKICKMTGTGYPCVYLNRKDGRQKNALMHRLVALACKDPSNHSIVEHLNDNREDYRPENLVFSTQKRNMRRAFENGRRDIPLRHFRLEMVDGRVFEGPMKKISKESGIPLSSCYFLLGLYDTKMVRDDIKSFKVIGQLTIERYGSDNPVERVE